MRTLGLALLFYVAMAMGQAHAAEITITLPDAQLRWIMQKVCAWHHLKTCQADDPLATIERLGELTIWMVSGGHLKTLADAQAQVFVRWDAP